MRVPGARGEGGSQPLLAESLASIVSRHGVRFDRFGALWLGGVELLRTTTPEPPGPGVPGIAWSVRAECILFSSVIVVTALRAQFAPLDMVREG